MRIDPVFIRVFIIIGFGRYVDDNGLFRADAHPAVADLGRDMDEYRIVDTQI